MLENIRLKLAGVDALPLLSVLGIISGIFSALVIIGFRLVVESTQASFLPDADPENYESLGVAARFLLPAAGGLLIGLLFQWVRKEYRAVGVAQVLERLSYHQGQMSAGNMLMQFVGAAISIISGHSVGREGPVIHLGASSSSLLGQFLKLPHNCLRVLVACGAAASIAASFNTPIAGVIFAMEVIVMEYTIAGFTPVILAAVSATVLTRMVFGDQPAFSVPALQLASMAELPLLVVMGVFIGAVAAAFISIMKFCVVKSTNMQFWHKSTLAGVIVGAIAVFVPQVMGVGYDTVNSAMLGQYSMMLLLTVVVAKLLASCVGLGLGLPGGLIGPTLVIGATAGGLVGVLGNSLYDGDMASAGFYAMLGMGAMMGATLQAPLAALMALLEMTVNTHIILPGMLVIVIAGLTSSHMFAKEGVFVMLLKAKGMDYRNDPVAQSLRRVGVASKMSRSFVLSPQLIQRETAQQLLLKEPQWVVVMDDKTPVALLPAADLLRFLSQQTQELDLLEIPADRFDAVQVSIRATLQQALELMEQRAVTSVYVGRSTTGGQTEVHGILTRGDIESHYRYK
ncbi:MAG: chloride channel protein [Gammaproteobacteria bacterium]|nr:chloride channel protein [Gammaproteobacteria bacterium]MDH5799704.1 chloride channel protein [Gammaproteobacteria bacterium]